jgi:TolB-like protein/class 3 adenylate cyclase
MSTELEPDLQLEIAHVLFVDIVGYSKLLINEQRAAVRELNDVVRNTDAFRVAEAADKLVRLPTGDGMALAFTSTPDAPVRCALQTSKALQGHPEFKLRMGVHSGPVSGMTDLNDRSNVTGAGINVAQRVMDCGDAGHILLSKRVAEDLAEYRHWQPYLHELGECEVKHGEVISLVNLYSGDVGNPALPSKLKNRVHPIDMADRPLPVRPPTLLMIAFAIAAVAAIGSWIVAVAPKSARAPALSNPSPVSSMTEKSIAVLPFDNLSTNQETAFFTDGVQDEILSNLAKVADLKVISRTSVMQYRTPRTRNLREIARQLGVAHVVEGSVQRVANRIRLNAQLIDARTDSHLWAQTYDRDLADVFAIQSEIARTIADQLQAKLSPKEEAALGSQPTQNLAAYEIYLRATEIDRSRASATGSGGAEATKREIALLEEAISQDPSFLSAICLLAQNHLYLHWMSADQSVDHLGLAQRALEAAARLQPNSAEVHLTRAILHYWGARDYAAALAELAQARRNLPNDARGLFFTAMIERRQNNWRDATRHLEQNLILDPCNITVVSELAGTYGVLLRYADSARTLDRALAWKPLDFNVGFLRAYVDFLWKADLRRWREVVGSEATKSADPKDVINARVDLALKERDYQRAEQLLANGGGTEVDDNGFFTPREWKEAIVARGLGQQSKATAAFNAARERVAATVQARPADAKTLMVLGQIDAALGRKDEALDEGRRAVELLPISKDAINGHQLLTRLVMIYVQVGEIDSAFDSLQKGIHRPYAPEYGSLKLDEVWDPLRGDPRFEKLVAALAPK